MDGGLKESHLAAVEWLACHCDAHVEGGEVGSRELTFIPGGLGKKAKVKGKRSAIVDLESNSIKLMRPGSVWLILQAILPFMIFGRSSASVKDIEGESGRAKDQEMIELTLQGGTNVPKSMSGEYVMDVLLPTLQRIGISGIEVDIGSRGWAGHAASTLGEVKIRVPRPSANGFCLSSFNLVERGEICSISVSMVTDTSLIEQNVQERLNAVVAEHYPNLPVHFDRVEDSGDTRRFYVQLVAHTATLDRIGTDYLGTGRSPKNGAEAIKMADVGFQTVIRGLNTEIRRQGCVDEYVQDQLVIFQALASGESQIDGGTWPAVSIHEDGEEDKQCGDESGSLHARTVRWVCERMLSKVGDGVRFRSGGVCHGVGWNARK